MSKNITLAVDEDVLKKARKIAAEENTTVNAMVRGFLADVAHRAKASEEQRLAALAQLKEMSRRSGVRLGKDYRFKREDAYEGRLR